MANSIAVVVMILQGHRCFVVARELGKRTGPATVSRLAGSRLQ